jgi:hypothetical protein
MSEKFEDRSATSSELIKQPESDVVPKQTEGLLVKKEAEPVETKEVQAVKRIIGIARAEVVADKTIEAANVDKLIDGIDFDSTDRLKFSIAARGHHNTVSEAVGRGSSAQLLGADGKLYDREMGRTGSDMGLRYHDEQHRGAAGKWGSPSEEAFKTGEVVEQVGISKSSDKIWVTETVRKPIPGIRGKLGFKKDYQESVLKEREPIYQFDYELAAPGAAKDALIGKSKNAEAGNFTGQNIKLSIKLNKEQAESLSKVLAEDSTVARKLLDRFMASHGDNGKWNSELFDEEGNFHNPVKRYGEDFSARDVRPHYESVPDLKPRIIGLVSIEDSAPKRYLAGTQQVVHSGLKAA